MRIKKLPDFSQGEANFVVAADEEYAQVKEIIAIGRLELLGQVNEKICALETMKRQLEYLVTILRNPPPQPVL